ncbi:deoxyribose-phosphate aldolase [Tissierella creatinini]|nr:deoxyribose-phosphate aldolase [Tissierella creatinini]TJX64441.1 deoxyribose-phosphate aldolase [Soehngenia saccharolytica]
MNNILSMIDHTLLKPEATREMIEKLCQEAIENNFGQICVNPYHVSYCRERLKDTKVKIATVIGFPLGANTKEIKSLEARDAIKNGADEIDMVINIGALKDKDYDVVRQDIEAVVNSSHPNALVKVIIETCLLRDEEKEKACLISMEAGADFVKTSTGFSAGGATVEDISLMKRVVGNKLGIKASGGVRDLEAARAMIEAGATRLGTSWGVKIAKELSE